MRGIYLLQMRQFYGWLFLLGISNLKGWLVDRIKEPKCIRPLSFSVAIQSESNLLNEVLRTFPFSPPVFPLNESGHCLSEAEKQAGFRVCCLLWICVVQSRMVFLRQVPERDQWLCYWVWIHLQIPFIFFCQWKNHQGGHRVECVNAEYSWDGSSISGQMTLWSLLGGLENLNWPCYQGPGSARPAPADKYVQLYLIGINFQGGVFLFGCGFLCSPFRRRKPTKGK